MDLLGAVWSDYTVRVVALGAAALGASSGALGSFAVLRRQSLLGDAISHAALPGIALAFLLTGSRAPLVLLAGAALTGWLGTLAVIGIVSSSRVKEDSALGMVLSVFFGIGLVLLTLVQRRPDAGQAGLDRFLFGQAATLLERDVWTIFALGAVGLLVVWAGWKEFKLLSFDPDFAATLGRRVRLLDVLLTSVLVVAIVIGLQTVGVVLMSAMVVAPAAAARQWTDRLGRMTALAGAFGAVAGVAGAVLSSRIPRLPTGPTIVLCLTLLVGVSLTLAPHRGLVWTAFAERRRRGVVRADAVLRDLQELARQHPGREHGHAVGALEAMRGGRGSVRRSLEALRGRGLVRESRPGEWVVTPAGVREMDRRSEAAGPGEEAGG